MLPFGFVVLSLLIYTTLQGTPVPSSGAAIPPLVWELVELTAGDAEPSAIAEPARYTIQFLPDGAVAIGADCNRVTGAYAISGDSLEIALKASPLARCPPDSQAEPFLGVLERAASFAFDREGNLTLSGSAGSLRFQPSLGGVVWEWQDFRGGDGSVVKPADSRRYTLAFLPDSKLAIRADCNRAMGTYTVDDAKLELTIRGVTRVMCPPGSLMNDYLRDLELVGSHVFRDGELYLALRLDAGIMAFAPRYVEPKAASPAPDEKPRP
jgi:heat shock protein HslJ